MTVNRGGESDTAITVNRGGESDPAVTADVECTRPAQ